MHAGRVLDLEILASGQLPHSATPALPAGRSLEWVLVRPAAHGVGLLQFDMQRGGMLSAPASLLALPSLAAVKEARQAQRALAGGSQHTQRCTSAALPFPVVPFLVTWRRSHALPAAVVHLG
jgi:hypothetical protein